MIMRIGSGPEQWQMLYINSDHESFSAWWKAAPGRSVGA